MLRGPFAYVLCCIALLQSSLSMAGSIPNGGVCLPPGQDPGPQSSWAARDATCGANSRCYPGVARKAVMRGGNKIGWYCIDKDSHCAYNDSANKQQAVGVNPGESVGPGVCQCDPGIIGTGRCQAIIPTPQRCKQSEFQWQNDGLNDYNIYVAYGPNFKTRGSFVLHAVTNECSGFIPFKYCVTGLHAPSCNPEALVSTGGGVMKFQLHHKDGTPFPY
jgi:predicted RNA binding protein YcfA (HicA-like mRNA interferase family)